MSRPFGKSVPFMNLTADGAGKRAGERAALATGGIAALLAGACCLGPLVIVTRFEPYQPVFIAVALAALGWAGWRIYRPAACEPGGVCAVPWVRRSYRIGLWIVAALLLVVLVFPYIAPLFY